MSASKGQIAKAIKKVKNGEVRRTTEEIYRDHDPNVNTYLCDTSKGKNFPPYLIKEIAPNTYTCEKLDQDDEAMELCRGYIFCSAPPNSADKICTHIEAVKYFRKNE